MFETPRMNHASNVKQCSTDANNIQRRWQDVNQQGEKFKKYIQWEKQFLMFFDDYRAKNAKEHPQEREFQEKRKKDYELTEWMNQILIEHTFLYQMMLKLTNRISKLVPEAIEIAKGEMKDPQFVLGTPPRAAAGLGPESTKAAPHEAQAVAEKVEEAASIVDLTMPS